MMISVSDGAGNPTICPNPATCGATGNSGVMEPPKLFIGYRQFCGDFMYPHPPAPALASTATNAVKGLAWCQAANYFAARQTDNTSRRNTAINTYGYACTFQ